MTFQWKGISFVVCMFTTIEESYIGIYITSSPCDGYTRNITPKSKRPSCCDTKFDPNSGCIHDSK